eukprot:1339461-Pyramimonas_sp.AAC.1
MSIASRRVPASIPASAAASSGVSKPWTFDSRGRHLSRLLGSGIDGIPVKRAGILVNDFCHSAM